MIGALSFLGAASLIGSIIFFFLSWWQKNPVHRIEGLILLVVMTVCFSGVAIADELAKSKADKK